MLSDAPSPLRQTLEFGPFGETLQFVNCPQMADGLVSILRGWHISEPVLRQPTVTFERKDGRYLWQSETRPAPGYWRRHPPRSSVNAICDFHYAFLGWFAVDNPTLYCLHAAAVEFAAGLVVFPCVMRAGKSTLVAELARLGHRVFCDDVLPIEMGSHAGLGLGILPRLRLPLPASVTEQYRSFVADRWGLSNDRYVYLALRDEELAPFGCNMPVRGVVTLSRALGERPTSLKPLSRGAALKSLIHQNYAKTIPPVAMFDDLHHLASQAHSVELIYSDVAEAAMALIGEFGSPDDE